MKDVSPQDLQSSAKLGESSHGDDEIDLIEVARTLWRGKLLIGLAMFFMAVFAIIYLQFIAVPFYTAKSVVALENRTETVVNLDSVMSGLSGDQATINTEVEVLRSRNLIGNLVDEMSLTQDPEFYTNDDDEQPAAEIIRDRVIDRVLLAIGISNISSSYVYTITAVTTSPEKSQRMVNTLAELYIREQMAVKFEATAQASAWLTERVAKLKSELETTEAQVQSFSSEISLVTPEELEALNRQVKDSRDRLSTLEQTRADLERQVTELETALASGSVEMMRGTAPDSTLNRLAENATSDTPSTAFLARYNALLTRAKTNFERTTEQVASLGASLDRLDADYSRQSRDLVALEQMQREATATRTIYEYFLTRLKETSVQEGIQQPDARIISYAAMPTQPSAPRKTRSLALALFLGMVIGAAIVLTREMLHSGFRNAEQLEALTGVTVMGQLPRIPATSRRSVIEYLVEKPTSAAAEAVRNLRTSLLLSNIDNPPKVILSTSSVPGEGKTTTAIALAQNFVGLGKSVLLMEGDTRRKVFSEYFELDESQGLLAVLSGQATFDEVVQHLDMIGADVLIGENSTTNAADIFSSDKFKAFIDQMRGRYDIVIIDTPPVLLVPDARIIAHSVDAVLFTVKWDSTTRSQVREAVRQFDIAGRSVTGLALGQIDPKGMKRYGYSDSYGAYADYGDKYYNS